MAIRAVHMPEVEVSQSPWEKVKDFFESLAELLDLYFGSPMRLDFLDSEYRANLSVKERAMLDADLHGIAR